MKAILFILLITDTSSFENNGQVKYTLTESRANMSWDDCSKTAWGINEYADVKVGSVTAVCFPYTEQDERDINERSRQHS